MCSLHSSCSFHVNVYQGTMMSHGQCSTRQLPLHRQHSCCELFVVVLSIWAQNPHQLSVQLLTRFVEHAAVNSCTDAVSAADLLSAQANGRRIRSGCNELDELLGGGGLATGSVTEFCGVPGVGKTQLG